MCLGVIYKQLGDRCIASLVIFKMYDMNLFLMLKSSDFYIMHYQCWFNDYSALHYMNLQSHYFLNVNMYMEYLLPICLEMRLNVHVFYLLPFPVLCKICLDFFLAILFILDLMFSTNCIFKNNFEVDWMDWNLI